MMPDAPKPHYLALNSTTKKLDSGISDGQRHTNSVKGIKQRRGRDPLLRGKTQWVFGVGGGGQCGFQWCTASSGLASPVPSISNPHRGKDRPLQRLRSQACFSYLMMLFGLAKTEMHLETKALPR